jgi:hypothetical protein
MSIKNLSQENYNRFVKNNSIDIFSQEKIKNIPRHRLVMMNNVTGGKYLPFDIHGLHNYLKHTNKHPIIRWSIIRPETKKKIKDKYIDSVIHDAKAMLSASSNVSEENFVKALKKAQFENRITNALVKARRNRTMPNTLVRNIHPDKIERVTHLLRTANNKQKNNTKVPNVSKAFAIEQRRKHNQILWKQQQHQAEIELNKNRNALGRASSIAQKVMAELERNPSKKEFKYPELGFKMNIQNTNSIIMTWSYPSKKRNRSGTSPSMKKIHIQAMKFTNWGYMPVSNYNTNVSRFWHVPEIVDPVPGSRASVMQMSKAVLLLLRKKAITNKNRRNNIRNMNNGDIIVNNVSNYTDEEIHTFFLVAGTKAYPVSLNNINAVPNIIRKVLNALHDEDSQMLVGVNDIDISTISVHIGERWTLAQKDVNTRLDGLNINGVAGSNAFKTVRLNLYQGHAMIRIRGSYTNLHLGHDSYFTINIDPSVHNSVEVDIR